MSTVGRVAVSLHGWTALARTERWQLAAEVWVAALLVRVLKHLVPLPRLVRLARTSGVRTLTPTQVSALLEQLQPANTAALRLPGNCLDRSIAIFRLLGPGEPTLRLVVGARKGDDVIDGHVWLTLKGSPLWDDPVWLAGFHPVIAFDREGRPSRPTTD